MSDYKSSNSKLLWLGCGDCEGLGSLNGTIDEYLLVDARSGSHLSIPENLNSSFKQAVVASDSKIASFKETNLPELSSLSGAQHLVDRFPGLAVENEREVKTIDISELALKFFADSKNATLIVDVPDYQMEILESLISSNTLNRLDEIIVWEVPQKASSEGKELSVENLLIDTGFVPFERNECFHGFNWLHFVKNPWRSKLKELDALKLKLVQLEQSLKNESEQKKAIELRHEELKKIGIRLESQIELIQKLISSDKSDRKFR